MYAITKKDEISGEI